MAETTSKLGLVKPTEDEYFDIVGDFNDNWDKIDGLVHIVESGKKTTNFFSPSTATSATGSVTWRYKKFNDGTFEMFGCLTVNNAVCGTAAADGSYRAAGIKIKYPSIGQNEVLYRNQAVRDGTDASDGSIYNSIVDISTAADSLTYSTVRLYATAKETKNRAKNIYIEAKGTWS